MEATTYRLRVILSPYNGESNGEERAGGKLGFKDVGFGFRV